MRSEPWAHKVAVVAWVRIGWRKQNKGDTDGAMEPSTTAGAWPDANRGMHMTTFDTRVSEKCNTDLYLTFYGEARKEVIMRHDFLQKTLTLSMVGIFALLSLAISKPFLFFLLRVV
jgi:hypothetical protein